MNSDQNSEEVLIPTKFPTKQSTMTVKPTEKKKDAPKEHVENNKNKNILIIVMGQEWLQR